MGIHDPSGNAVGVSGFLRGAANDWTYFDDYLLNMGTGDLYCASALVPLEPQVKKLIVYLARHAGRLVTRTELLETLWQERERSDGALNYAVRRARQALHATHEPAITTYRGRGYRFEATVQERDSPACAAQGAPLLERKRELRALWAALSLCERQRRPGLVLVTGMVGIGRSALVNAFRLQLFERGMRCLFGTCTPATTVSTGEFWNGLLGFSPEPEVAAHSPSEHFGDIRQKLERVAGEAPLVVILDDIQEASAQTWELLALLSTVGERPVLHVATCQTPLPPIRQHEFGALARHARVVSLDPLSSSASRMVMASLLQQPLDRKAELEALRMAAGNPLFLTEIAGDLKDEQGFEASQLFRAPSAVEGALRRHLAALSKETIELLQFSALLGDKFDCRVLSIAANCDVRAIVKRLESAVALQIVKPRTQLEFQFALPLVQSFLQHLTPDMQRREWYWALGSALARLARERTPAMFSMAARYLAHGVVSREQALEAMQVGILAATASSDQRDYARAAEEYARSFNLAEQAGLDPCGQVDVALQTVTAFHQASVVPTAPFVDRTIALTRQCTDALRSARLTLGLCHLHDVLSGPMPTDMVELVETAVQRLPPGCAQLEAQLYARLAQNQHARLDLAERMALSERALEAAAVTQDAFTLAVVFGARARLQLGSAVDREACSESVASASLAASAARAPALRLEATICEATWYLVQGDLEGVRLSVESVQGTLESVPLATAETWLRVFQAAMATVRGEGPLEFEGVPNSVLRLQSMVRAMDEVASDRDAAARAPVSAEIQRPLFLAVSGVVAARAGDRKGAARAFQRLARQPAFGLTRDAAPLATLVVLAELCAAVGDAPRKRALYSRLLPFSGCLGVAGRCECIVGSSDYALALLAAEVESPARARKHLRAARQMALKLQAKTWLRRCDAALAAFASEAWQSKLRPRSLPPEARRVGSSPLTPKTESNMT